MIGHSITYIYEEQFIIHSRMLYVTPDSEQLPVLQHFLWLFFFKESYKVSVKISQYYSNCKNNYF